MLESRKVRDALEHFDDRLDRHFEAGHRMVVDRNIGPKNRLLVIVDKRALHLRLIDAEARTVSVLEDEVPIQGLFDAIDDVSDGAHGWLGSGTTSGSGLVRVKTMARGAIPAMSCPATWPPLAVHPAAECTKPDAGVVSSSDKKAVIAFLTLSQDQLDLRAQQCGEVRTLSGWPGNATVPDGPSMWSETKSAIGRAEPSMAGSASYARPPGSRLNEVGS